MDGIQIRNALIEKWEKRMKGPYDGDNYIWTSGFDAGMRECISDVKKLLDVKDAPKKVSNG